MPFVYVCTIMLREIMWLDDLEEDVRKKGVRKTKKIGERLTDPRGESLHRLQRRGLFTHKLHILLELV